VLNYNDGLVQFPGVVEHDDAGDAVELRAQVRGGQVQSYAWDLSQASLATNVTGQNSYRLQFDWDSYVPQPTQQQITLTVTLADNTQLSQTLSFEVQPGQGDGSGGGSGGSGSAAWPAVLAPELYQSAGAAVDSGYATGPYAVTLAGGELLVSHTLPEYNGGARPCRDGVASTACAFASP